MNDTPAFIKYEKTTRALKIGATVTMIISLLCVLGGGISELFLRNDFVVPFCLVAAGCVVYAAMLPLYFIANKRRAVIVRYNAYKKVLMRNPHNSVAEICEVKKVEPDVVVADLEMMVKSGFFEGLSVDVEGKKADLFTGAEKQIFVCPVCGGKNHIDIGDEQKCEFCGAIKEKENK